MKNDLKKNVDCIVINISKNVNEQTIDTIFERFDTNFDVKFEKNERFDKKFDEKIRFDVNKNEIIE